MYGRDTKSHTVGQAFRYGSRIRLSQETTRETVVSTGSEGGVLPSLKVCLRGSIFFLLLFN